MKKFTKAIAAFCAMAMIFGTFSATVFADETDVAGENVASGEAVDGAQQEEGSDPEDSDDKDSKKADKEAEKAEKQAEKEAEKAEKEAVKEAEKAEKEAGKEAKKEAKQEAKLLGAGQDQSGDQAGEQPSTATEQGNGIDTNESVPEPEPVKAPSLFANGLITQDDINANNGRMPTVGGTYTVAEPITVSTSAEVQTPGESITIDLNGKTITYTGAGSFYKLGYNETVDGAIHVYGNISLTIRDSGTGGTILASGGANKGSVDHWVSITAKNGVAKIGTDDYRGGCILIENGCSFTFEGGTISGFHAGDEGGGVHVSNGGTFTMTGGCITGCSAAKNSGGVSVHGASNGATTNSSIYYHSTADGDPVYGPVSIVASAYISGGVIENNSTSGVGGGIRALRGNLEITGGTITGNRANNSGGGIAVTKGNVYSPSFTISGSPKISGNSCNTAKFSNLYFTDGAGFTLSGDLSSSAEIYFNSSNPGGNSFIAGSYTYSIDSFSCDDATYIPYAASNGNVKLSVEPKVSGYNLVIGGEILVKVNLQLGAYNNSSTSVSYSYSYSKNGNTTNVEKTLAFSELTKSGSDYYFNIPVESACLTSDITVKVNYGTDGESTATTSAAECAYYIINHETDETYTLNVKAVAKALVYFGYCAQMQFNINTANLPAIVEPGDDFNTLTGASYTIANDPDGAFYGASVAFLSKTEVNLYFKKSVLGDTAPAMTVTYTGGATETVTATLNGNYYMYTVKGPTGDGFVATQFDTPFSFAVGNVSGDYSVNTYLQVMEYKYNGSSNNVLLKLVEAYNDFAKKCQQL